jgi:hypothetical protein
MAALRNGEPDMPIARQVFSRLVFAGTLAAIAAIATPALAKNSERQKADDKSTNSAGCQAYQQAADGTWTQLPCTEPGASGAAPSRSATKGADEDGR